MHYFILFFINFRFNDTFIKKSVNETNLVFGGQDINIDRIVFTHGTVDPWYPLGLYHSSDKKNYDVIFIKGTYTPFGSIMIKD